MREVALRITIVACAMFLVDVPRADAGYRCGPGGEPDPALGCKCPAPQQPRRNGKDWVCVSSPARPPIMSSLPPTLASPVDGATDVDCNTSFDVAAPPGATQLEIEICDDPECRIPMLVKAVPIIGDQALFRAWGLPDTHSLFWRARGRLQGQAGPWCAARAFTSVSSAALACRPTDDGARTRPALIPGAAPLREATREVLRHVRAAFFDVPDPRFQEGLKEIWVKEYLPGGGTTCLPRRHQGDLDAPTLLESDEEARYELGAISDDAVLCLIGRSVRRPMGPAGCWGVEVMGARAGMLIPEGPAPLPGRGLRVSLFDGCTRGYCLPKGAGAAAAPGFMDGLIVVNLAGDKVAVLAGDAVHIYNAASRAHEASFSIRGPMGVTSEPTAIYWIGDKLFIEATNGTTSPVWVFSTEGTPRGPITSSAAANEAVLSTLQGSFVVLDSSRVAIAERGFSSLTVYEIATGKRTRVVRKLPASPCTRAEFDALWRNPPGSASKTCRAFAAKNYAHLVGADAIAWKGSLLVLLRGPRLGELAVLDADTLAERKRIRMPWCK